MKENITASDKCIVIGDKARATGTHSISIGDGVVNDEPYTIKVGTHLFGNKLPYSFEGLSFKHLIK